MAITLLLSQSCRPGFAEDQQRAKSAQADDSVEVAKPTSGTKQADGDNQRTNDRKQRRPVVNPLTQILQKLLQPGRQNATPGTKPEKTEDKPSEGQESATPRDHIDARAPHDPKQANLLRRAARQLRDGNWKASIDILQFLLDRSEDSLVRKPNGEWALVRLEASRLLGQLPEAGRTHYELRFGPIAAQLFRDGERDGDLEKLVEAATKFFHTTAGYQAANRLGTLHFDRGEFGMAAHWFAKLLEAGAPVTNDPKWRMKAALAMQQSGDFEAGERLLSGLASTAPDRSFELGGKPVDPEDWLEEPVDLLPAQRIDLDDWPVLFGSASRTGSVVGGEPILLPRWSAPTTSADSIRKQTSLLIEDLADERHAMIPAFFPLMVDDKVIFRSLRGVQVVDAASGRSLWETREGVSAERLLNGDFPQQFTTTTGRRRRGRRNQLVPRYVGSGASQHPLTGLLFRNGTYGVISSDGEQLFVIEDHAVLSRQLPGSNLGHRDQRYDPYRRNWSSNRLTAYDLRNGRPIWDIGGTEMNEPFDLPLAGTYFFGAPVPEGDELFIVGEKDNEIRLHVLTRKTGEPSWSRLIAYSDAKIADDLGRRWWNCQVSVGSGVLVCPTTAGWLVGVDRLERSVLWAYRYSKPKSQTRSNSRPRTLVRATALNERWSPSAPVITDNRVVYTPSEEPVIVCLNLFSGKRRWQKPKDDFLYLAGVFEKRVVVVGKTSIAAFSLDEGEKLWSLPISPVDGPPSGVGVAVASRKRYYLPLSSGQLWSINLESGVLSEKAFLGRGNRGLGNLAMYRGMMLSMHPLGMTSFEQLEAIEQEIQQHIDENPRNAWALLRQSDISLLDRDYAAALTSLRKIQPDELADEDLPHFRESMIECLSTQIRAEFENSDGDMSELERVVRTPEEQWKVRRIAAERHESLSEYPSAFRQFWNLAVEGTDRVVDRGDGSNVEVSIVPWASGKLADLWEKMPAGEREELEEQIVLSATAAKSGNRDARERFVKLFGFHRSSIAIQWTLVEEYAKTGEFVRAEHKLLKLSRHADDAVAANALVRLARLQGEFGLHRDARHYYRILETKFADTLLADGTTVRQLLDRLRTESSLDLPAETDQNAWTDIKLKVIRSGTNYTSSNDSRELAPQPRNLPFFRDYRFQVLQQQRLGIFNAADDSLHWLLPLRSAPRPLQGNTVVSRTAGHRLLVLYRDFLHCLSPLQRTILWTQPMETRGRSSGYYRVPRRRSIQSLPPGTGILATSSLEQQAAATGMLAVANPEYVCVYGHRSISVLDALTGEVRWKHNGVEPRTKVYGSDSVVYVVPPERKRAIALRAIDGKRLDVERVGDVITQSISISAKGLVLVESTSAESPPTAGSANITVRLYDPFARRQHWSRVYPRRTGLSLLDEQHLLALRPSGEIELVDLEHGGTRTIGETISEADRAPASPKYVVNDDDRIYLIINRQRRNRHRNRNTYATSLPSVRVNGLMLAFDRHSGKQLWKQSFSEQSLVLEQLNESPVLVFATKQFVRTPKLSYPSMNLIAINKDTGQRLVQHSAPSNFGFRSLKINMSQRYVELLSYNQRVRLVPVENQAAAVDE
jgi:outer membrane protein assembly factor BamB